MRLFLSSSTITPNLQSEFQYFAGRDTAGMKVAFIPDAAYGEEGNSWLNDEIAYQRDSLKISLDIFTLRDKSLNETEELLNYDAIFIAGGLIVDLHQVMQESGFTTLLPEILSKDIIYIGSSASSMIMAKEQDAASWYVDEEEPEAKNISGFGLIDFQIYPHYSEKYLPQILKLKDDKLEYRLLKDGQAISITEDAIQSHGGEIVIIKSV